MIVGETKTAMPDDCECWAPDNCAMTGQCAARVVNPWSKPMDQWEIEDVENALNMGTEGKDKTAIDGSYK